MKATIAAAAGFLLLAGACAAQVRTGFDVLEDNGFALLEGKRVGLITNHTGLDRNGESIVKKFAAAKNLRLVALFSPEHGFSGTLDHGQKAGESVDGQTGLPIHSLYGKTLRPTPEMLEGIDALVFDIQDAGARFYTYLATMAYAMEEADKKLITFYVLDRPNPVTGEIVEGPVLDDSVRALTAYFKVPIRHGMTAGEIALMHAEAKGLYLKPEVVKMRGWTRRTWYDRTGMKWTNPSPNIRSLDAETLYPGIGCFEATNVGVGRGTPSPFMWIGAPWLDARAVLAKFKGKKIKGVKLSHEKRTPDGDVYAGQESDGIAFRITDRNALRPVELFLRLLCAMRDTKQAGLNIKWEDMKRMTGDDTLKDLYSAGAPAEKIIAAYNRAAKNFRKTRTPYLLYK